MVTLIIVIKKRYYAVWWCKLRAVLSALGGSSRRSRPHGTASLTQQQQFMERMQHAQNQWSEQQRQLSHARDEALMSQLIAETTRSTSVLITQLLTGLGALFQRPTPQPVFTKSQPQPKYHPYNNHFDNYGQPPATPHRVPSCCKYKIWNSGLITLIEN